MAFRSPFIRTRLTLVTVLDMRLPDKAASAIEQFSLLDLARIIAASWVVIAHLLIMTGHPRYPFAEGRIAVDVFIFLSGFLMFLLLSNGIERLTPRGVLAFYIRRFFRIAPCFYLALLVYVCFREFYSAHLRMTEAYFGTAGSFSHYVLPVNLPDIVLHATFLHGLWQGEATKIFGPAWTLSLEMQFYAVAPFVVFLLQKSPILAFSAAFIPNLIARLLVGDRGSPGLLSYDSFPSFLPDRLFLFFFGAVTCLFIVKPGRETLTLLIAAIIASASLFPIDSIVTCLVLQLGLFGVLYSKLSAVRLLRRFCATGIVKLGAEYSYSLYLIHQFCMAIVGLIFSSRFLHTRVTLLTTIEYAIAVWLISLSAAAIMFHTVERPMRTYGRRLAGILLP